MGSIESKGKSRIADWVNLVLGIVLFVSPWVLGYADGGVAVWNACYSGAIVAVLAFYALANFSLWHERLMAVAGLWILVSPWVIGFTGIATALWVHVVLGIAVTALAGWRNFSTMQQNTDTHVRA